MDGCRGLGKRRILDFWHSEAVGMRPIFKRFHSWEHLYRIRHCTNSWIPRNPKMWFKRNQRVSGIGTTNLANSAV